MPVLDHIIVSVNDREASLGFYTEVLGFEDEGERGPFNQVRFQLIRARHPLSSVMLHDTPRAISLLTC